MHDASDDNTAAGMELTQFHALFFDEAGENLERLERLLLDLDLGAPDKEALNAIFRCAHSVKGGAATFGFADVAELTHQVETLLDRLRRGEMTPSMEMVDALLQAGDTLKAQLAHHQSGAGDAHDATALLAALHGLVGPGTGPTTAPTATPVPVERRLQLRLGPIDDAQCVAEVVALFTDIPDLGRIQADASMAATPGLHHFIVHTRSSDAELNDLFAFHVSASQVRLVPATPMAPTPRQAAPAAAAAVAETPSLRVPLDKVDQLINLVGELVITQAMLAQRCAALEPPAQRQLAAGFADLQRHTRNLQESVMSIRMIPVSVVFSRFPRLLRELGRQLGKKAELVTLGEATELDKGLIEKITDPLTHLVRNSLDHGIEPPAERVAAGKRETGTITLAAMHQGGSIVIEVRDDGRGLSRERLLRKARERGLAAPDTLGDDAVWALILAPGFSTAEQVTEVSGRGVGLDVVQRNIASLGGAVEIESLPGQGMTIRVRLPLTLAIMDSMSVRVADECYVLPLSAVVESMPLAAARLHGLGGPDGERQLLRHRELLLPVLDLAQLFNVPRAGHGPDAASILVVVEADGARIALRVDELLGQQQVVVKNLEANFTRVHNISGATLMGDGRVALIIDVAALVRRSRS